MKYKKNVYLSLDNILNKNKYSNLEINEAIGRLESKSEKNLYVLTVYGVLENLIFIDWIISQNSNIRIKKIQKNVLNIIRVAVFQIYFMEAVSEKNTVYESVEEVKTMNYNAASFVNGLLRNIIRKKENNIADIEKLSRIEKIAVKYSFTENYVKKLVNEFGIENAEKFCISTHEKSRIYIRTNVLKIKRDELAEILRLKKYVTENTLYADKGLLIKNNATGIMSVNEYKKGYYTIQSESSMLVAQILNPYRKSQVIDLCSAPGSKGLHCAEIMMNTGNVHCVDKYENRIGLVKKDAERLGLSNVTYSVEDSTKENSRYLSVFDFAVVDVPCSNSGIISRKPEIKYKNNEFGENLKDIQYCILENAGKYLKNGGVMTYSTCSVFSEENIDIIKEFINNNKKEFQLVSLHPKYANIDNDFEKGYLKIYPHKNNMDGFFISLIRKL